ncbi:HAD-IA family hydrolase [Kiritimatiellaeota bacterium B1221]|nr:HAD-IA family hydrolase [Kiritimatiellaeota bacterium B1221]
MTSPTWAALFDWDGVIIDSAKAHEISWERLSGETGLPLPSDHFLRGFGKRNEVIFPEILQWGTDPAQIKTWSLRKEALYREVVEEQGVRVLPGVRTYLQSLRDAGIPAVIGTSTQRENVEMIFEMMDLRNFFCGIVSAEDVSCGKPDPEVFLKAAAIAGRPPQNCVVFEDAPYGIEAAIAGGMRSVGVLTTHKKEGLPGADRWVPQLDALPLDGSLPLPRTC